MATDPHSFIDELDSFTIRGDLWFVADGNKPIRPGGTGRGSKQHIVIEHGRLEIFSSSSDQAKMMKGLTMRSMRRVSWFAHDPLLPTTTNGPAAGKGSNAGGGAVATTLRGGRGKAAGGGASASARAASAGVNGSNTTAVAAATKYYYLVVEASHEGHDVSTLAPVVRRDRLVFSTDVVSDFHVWMQFFDQLGPPVSGALLLDDERRSVSMMSVDGESVVSSIPPQQDMSHLMLNNSEATSSSAVDAALRAKQFKLETERLTSFATEWRNRAIQLYQSVQDAMDEQKMIHNNSTISAKNNNNSGSAAAVAGLADEWPTSCSAIIQQLRESLLTPPPSTSPQRELFAASLVGNASTATQRPHSARHSLGNEPWSTLQDRSPSQQSSSVEVGILETKVAELQRLVQHYVQTETAACDIINEFERRNRSSILPVNGDTPHRLRTAFQYLNRKLSAAWVALSSQPRSTSAQAASPVSRSQSSDPRKVPLSSPFLSSPAQDDVGSGGAVVAVPADSTLVEAQASVQLPVDEIVSTISMVRRLIARFKSGEHAYYIPDAPIAQQLQVLFQYFTTLAPSLSSVRSHYHYTHDASSSQQQQQDDTEALVATKTEYLLSEVARLKSLLEAKELRVAETEALIARMEEHTGQRAPTKDNISSRETERAVVDLLKSLEQQVGVRLPSGSNAVRLRFAFESLFHSTTPLVHQLISAEEKAAVEQLMMHKTQQIQRLEKQLAEQRSIQEDLHRQHHRDMTSMAAITSATTPMSRSHSAMSAAATENTTAREIQRLMALLQEKEEQLEFLHREVHSAQEVEGITFTISDLRAENEYWRLRYGKLEQELLKRGGVELPPGSPKLSATPITSSSSSTPKQHRPVPAVPPTTTTTTAAVSPKLSRETVERQLEDAKERVASLEHALQRAKYQQQQGGTSPSPAGANGTSQSSSPQGNTTATTAAGGGAAASSVHAHGDEVQRFVQLLTMKNRQITTLQSRCNDLQQLQLQLHQQQQPSSSSSSPKSPRGGTSGSSNNLSKAQQQQQHQTAAAAASATDIPLPTLRNPFYDTEQTALVLVEQAEVALRMAVPVGPTHVRLNYVFAELERAYFSNAKAKEEDDDDEEEEDSKAMQRSSNNNTTTNTKEVHDETISQVSATEVLSLRPVLCTLATILEGSADDVPTEGSELLRHVRYLSTSAIDRIRRASSASKATSPVQPVVPPSPSESGAEFMRTERLRGILFKYSNNSTMVNPESDGEECAKELERLLESHRLQVKAIASVPPSPSKDDPVNKTYNGDKRELSALEHSAIDAITDMMCSEALVQQQEGGVNANGEHEEDPSLQLRQGVQGLLKVIETLRDDSKRLRSKESEIRRELVQTRDELSKMTLQLTEVDAAKDRATKQLQKMSRMTTSLAGDLSEQYAALYKTSTTSHADCIRMVGLALQDSVGVHHRFARRESTHRQSQDQGRRKVEDELRGEIQDAHELQARLEQEIGKWKRDAQTTALDAEHLRDEISLLSRRLQDSERKSLSLGEEVDHLEARLAEKESSLVTGSGALQRQLETLQRDYARVHDDLAAKEIIIASLQKSSETSGQTLRSDLDVLRQQVTSLGVQLEESKAALRSVSAENLKLQQQLSEARSTTRALEEELEQEVQSTRKHVSVRQSELNELVEEQLRQRQSRDREIAQLQEASEQAKRLWEQECTTLHSRIEALQRAAAGGKEGVSVLCLPSEDRRPPQPTSSSADVDVVVSDGDEDPFANIQPFNPKQPNQSRRRSSAAAAAAAGGGASSPILDATSTQFVTSVGGSSSSSSLATPGGGDTSAEDSFLLIAQLCGGIRTGQSKSVIRSRMRAFSSWAMERVAPFGLNANIACGSVAETIVWAMEGYFRLLRSTAPLFLLWDERAAELNLSVSDAIAWKVRELAETSQATSAAIEAAKDYAAAFGSATDGTSQDVIRRLVDGCSVTQRLMEALQCNTAEDLEQEVFQMLQGRDRLRRVNQIIANVPRSRLGVSRFLSQKVTSGGVDDTSLMAEKWLEDLLTEVSDVFDVISECVDNVDDTGREGETQSPPRTATQQVMTPDALRMTLASTTHVRRELERCRNDLRRTLETLSERHASEVRALTQEKADLSATVEELRSRLVSSVDNHRDADVALQQAMSARDELSQQLESTEDALAATTAKVQELDAQLKRCELEIMESLKHFGASPSSTSSSSPQSMIAVAMTTAQRLRELEQVIQEAGWAIRTSRGGAASGQRTGSASPTSPRSGSLTSAANPASPLTAGASQNILSGGSPPFEARMLALPQVTSTTTRAPSVDDASQTALLLEGEPQPVVPGFDIATAAAATTSSSAPLIAMCKTAAGEIQSLRTERDVLTRDASLMRTALEDVAFHLRVEAAELRSAERSVFLTVVPTVVSAAQICRQNLDQLSQDNKHLNVTLQGLQQRCEQLAEELASAQDHINTTTQSWTSSERDASTRIRDLKKELEDAKRCVEGLQHEYDTLQTNTSAEIDSLQQRCVEAQLAWQSLSEEVANLTHMKEEAHEVSEARIRELTEHRDGLLRKNETLMREANAALSTITSARGDIRSISDLATSFVELTAAHDIVVAEAGELHARRIIEMRASEALSTLLFPLLDGCRAATLAASALSVSLDALPESVKHLASSEALLRTLCGDLTVGRRESVSRSESIVAMREVLSQLGHPAQASNTQAVGTSGEMINPDVDDESWTTAAKLPSLAQLVVDASKQTSFELAQLKALNMQLISELRTARDNVNRLSTGADETQHHYDETRCLLEIHRVELEALEVRWSTETRSLESLFSLAAQWLVPFASSCSQTATVLASPVEECPDVCKELLANDARQKALLGDVAVFRKDCTSRQRCMTAIRDATTLLGGVANESDLSSSLLETASAAAELIEETQKDLHATTNELRQTGVAHEQLTYNQQSLSEAHDALGFDNAVLAVMLEEQTMRRGIEVRGFESFPLGDQLSTAAVCRSACSIAGVDIGGLCQFVATVMASESQLKGLVGDIAVGRRDGSSRSRLLQAMREAVAVLGGTESDVDSPFALLSAARLTAERLAEAEEQLRIYMPEARRAQEEVKYLASSLKALQAKTEDLEVEAHRESVEQLEAYERQRVELRYLESIDLSVIFKAAKVGLQAASLAATSHLDDTISELTAIITSEMRLKCLVGDTSTSAAAIGGRDIEVTRANCIAAILQTIAVLGGEVKGDILSSLLTVAATSAKAAEDGNTLIPMLSSDLRNVRDELRALQKHCEHIENERQYLQHARSVLSTMFDEAVDRRKIEKQSTAAATDVLVPFVGFAASQAVRAANALKLDVVAALPQAVQSLQADYRHYAAMVGEDTLHPTEGTRSELLHGIIECFDALEVELPRTNMKASLIAACRSCKRQAEGDAIAIQTLTAELKRTQEELTQYAVAALASKQRVEQSDLLFAIHELEIDEMASRHQLLVEEWCLQRAASIDHVLLASQRSASVSASILQVSMEQLPREVQRLVEETVSLGALVGDAQFSPSLGSRADVIRTLMATRDVLLSTSLHSPSRYHQSPLDIAATVAAQDLVEGLRELQHRVRHLEAVQESLREDVGSLVACVSAGVERIHEDMLRRRGTTTSSSLSPSPQRLLSSTRMSHHEVSTPPRDGDNDTSVATAASPMTRDLIKQTINEFETAVRDASVYAQYTADRVNATCTQLAAAQAYYMEGGAADTAASSSSRAASLQRNTIAHQYTISDLCDMAVRIAQAHDCIADEHSLLQADAAESSAGVRRLINFIEFLTSTMLVTPTITFALASLSAQSQPTVDVVCEKASTACRSLVQEFQEAHESLIGIQKRLGVAMQQQQQQQQQRDVSQGRLSVSRDAIGSMLDTNSYGDGDASPSPNRSVLNYTSVLRQVESHVQQRTAIEVLLEEEREANARLHQRVEECNHLLQRSNESHASIVESLEAQIAQKHRQTTELVASLDDLRLCVGELEAVLASIVHVARLPAAALEQQQQQQQQHHHKRSSMLIEQGREAATVLAESLKTLEILNGDVRGVKQQFIHAQERALRAEEEVSLMHKRLEESAAQLSSLMREDAIRAQELRALNEQLDHHRQEAIAASQAALEAHDAEVRRLNALLSERHALLRDAQEEATRTQFNLQSQVTTLEGVCATLREDLNTANATAASHHMSLHTIFAALRCSNAEDCVARFDDVVNRSRRLHVEYEEVSHRLKIVSQELLDGGSASHHVLLGSSVVGHEDVLRQLQMSHHVTTRVCSVLGVASIGLLPARVQRLLHAHDELALLCGDANVAPLPESVLRGAEHHPHKGSVPSFSPSSNFASRSDCIVAMAHALSLLEDEDSDNNNGEQQQQQQRLPTRLVSAVTHSCERISRLLADARRQAAENQDLRDQVSVMSNAFVSALTQLRNVYHNLENASSESLIAYGGMMGVIRSVDNALRDNADYVHQLRLVVAKTSQILSTTKNTSSSSAAAAPAAAGSNGVVVHVVPSLVVDETIIHASKAIVEEVLQLRQRVGALDAEVEVLTAQKETLHRASITSLSALPSSSGRMSAAADVDGDCTALAAELENRAVEMQRQSRIDQKALFDAVTILKDAVDSANSSADNDSENGSSNGGSSISSMPLPAAVVQLSTKASQLVAMSQNHSTQSSVTLRRAEQRLEQLKSDMRSASELHVQECEALREQHNQDVARLQQSVTSWRDQCQTLRETQTELEATIEAVCEALNVNPMLLHDTLNTSNPTSSKSHLVADQREELVTACTSLKHHLSALQQKYRQQSQDLKASQERREALSTQLSQRTDSLGAVEAELASLKRSSANEMSTLQFDLTNANENICQLRQQLEALAAEHGDRGDVLDRTVKEHDETVSRIRELHGTEVELLHDRLRDREELLRVQETNVNDLRHQYLLLQFNVERHLGFVHAQSLDEAHDVYVLLRHLVEQRTVMMEELHARWAIGVRYMTEQYEFQECVSTTTAAAATTASLFPDVVLSQLAPATQRLQSQLAQAHALLGDCSSPTIKRVSMTRAKLAEAVVQAVYSLLECNNKSGDSVVADDVVVEMEYSSSAEMRPDVDVVLTELVSATVKELQESRALLASRNSELRAALELNANIQGAVRASLTDLHAARCAVSSSTMENHNTSVAEVVGDVSGVSSVTGPNGGSGGSSWRELAPQVREATTQWTQQFATILNAAQTIVPVSMPHLKVVNHTASSAVIDCFPQAVQRAATELQTLREEKRSLTAIGDQLRHDLECYTSVVPQLVRMLSDVGTTSMASLNDSFSLPPDASNASDVMNHANLCGDLQESVRSASADLKRLRRHTREGEEVLSSCGIGTHGKHIGAVAAEAAELIVKLQLEGVNQTGTIRKLEQRLEQARGELRAVQEAQEAESITGELRAVEIEQTHKDTIEKMRLTMTDMQNEISALKHTVSDVAHLIEVTERWDAEAFPAFSEALIHKVDEMRIQMEQLTSTAKHQATEIKQLKTKESDLLAARSILEQQVEQLSTEIEDTHRQGSARSREHKKELETLQRSIEDLHIALDKEREEHTEETAHVHRLEAEVERRTQVFEEKLRDQSELSTQEAELLSKEMDTLKADKQTITSKLEGLQRQVTTFLRNVRCESLDVAAASVDQLHLRVELALLAEDEHEARLRIEAREHDALVGCCHQGVVEGGESSAIATPLTSSAPLSLLSWTHHTLVRLASKLQCEDLHTVDTVFTALLQSEERLQALEGDMVLSKKTTATRADMIRSLMDCRMYLGLPFALDKPELFASEVSAQVAIMAEQCANLSSNLRLQNDNFEQSTTMAQQLMEAANTACLMLLGPGGGQQLYGGGGSSPAPSTSPAGGGGGLLLSPFSKASPGSSMMIMQLHTATPTVNRSTTSACIAQLERAAQTTAEKMRLLRSSFHSSLQAVAQSLSQSHESNINNVSVGGSSVMTGGFGSSSDTLTESLAVAIERIVREVTTLRASCKAQVDELAELHREHDTYRERLPAVIKTFAFALNQQRQEKPTRSSASAGDTSTDSVTSEEGVSTTTTTTAAPLSAVALCSKLSQQCTVLVDALSEMSKQSRDALQHLQSIPQIAASHSGSGLVLSAASAVDTVQTLSVTIEQRNALIRKLENRVEALHAETRSLSDERDSAVADRMKSSRDMEASHARTVDALKSTLSQQSARIQMLSGFTHDVRSVVVAIEDTAGAAAVAETTSTTTTLDDERRQLEKTSAAIRAMRSTLETTQQQLRRVTMLQENLDIEADRLKSELRSQSDRADSLAVHVQELQLKLKLTEKRLVTETDTLTAERDELHRQLGSERREKESKVFELGSRLAEQNSSVQRLADMCGLSNDDRKSASVIVDAVQDKMRRTDDSLKSFADTVASLKTDLQKSRDAAQNEKTTLLSAMERVTAECNERRTKEETLIKQLESLLEQHHELCSDWANDNGEPLTVYAIASTCLAQVVRRQKLLDITQSAQHQLELEHLKLTSQLSQYREENHRLQNERQDMSKELTAVQRAFHTSEVDASSQGAELQALKQQVSKLFTLACTTTQRELNLPIVDTSDRTTISEINAIMSMMQHIARRFRNAPTDEEIAKMKQQSTASLNEEKHLREQAEGWQALLQEKILPLLLPASIRTVHGHSSASSLHNSIMESIERIRQYLISTLQGLAQVTDTTSSDNAFSDVYSLSRAVADSTQALQQRYERLLQMSNAVAEATHAPLLDVTSSRSFVESTRRWAEGMLSAMRQSETESEQFCDRLVDLLKSFGVSSLPLSVSESGNSSVLVAALGSLQKKSADLTERRLVILKALQDHVRSLMAQQVHLTSEWQALGDQNNRLLLEKRNLLEERDAIQSHVTELRKAVRRKLEDDQRVEQQLQTLDQHLEMQSRELAFKYQADRDIIQRRFADLKGVIHSTLQRAPSVSGSDAGGGRMSHATTLRNVSAISSQVSSRSSSSAAYGGGGAH